MTFLPSQCGYQKKKVLVNRLFSAILSSVCFVFNRMVIGSLELEMFEILYKLKIVLTSPFQRVIVFYISRYFYTT